MPSLDEVAYAAALERLRQEATRMAEAIVLAAAAAQHVPGDDDRALSVMRDCQAILCGALDAAPGFAALFERGT